MLLPLVLLAAPAIALKTGPPNVANLPPDNAARKSYEAFERSRGAGWSTPYEVVFHTKGPITTTQRLRALGRFQDRVAKLDGVEAVLGPAALLDRTAVLRKITRDITGGQKQVKRLESGPDAHARRHRAAARRAGRRAPRARASSPTGSARPPPARSSSPTGRERGGAADAAPRRRRAADRRRRQAARPAGSARPATAPASSRRT